MKKKTDAASFLDRLLYLVENSMGTAEAILVAVVGRVACWLAPLPSAVLVANAASGLFELAGVWAAIIAIVLELVGLVTSNLWLNALEWNRTKRANDPPANEKLSRNLMAVYFITTFLLLLAVEVPRMITERDIGGLTALLFPVISIVGILALNERMLQWHRKKAVIDDKAEKKTAREERAEKKRLTLEKQAEREERRAFAQETRVSRQTSNGRRRGAVTTVEVDAIINEISPTDFEVECPCGFQGSKTYDTRGRARMAASAHRRTCDVSLDAPVKAVRTVVESSPLPPGVVERNGDF